MRHRLAATSLVAFGLFGLSALGARSAFADTSCTKDSDCVKGWTCQVTGASGCASACAPGENCSPPVCTTTEIKSCEPGPCKADSDCATGMVCYTSTTSCDTPVPTCPPGADCEAPPPCTPTTQSQCIPRYDAPCKADADCGAGFSCFADSTSCNCAGGAAPSADGGAPLPPDNICNCPPSTTSSCHALPVTCNTAADCATGWTCEDMPTDVTCVSAGAPAEPPSSGGSGATPTPTPAQDAGVDPCPPPPPAMKMCLPPYYSIGGGSLGISAPTGSAPGGTTTATGSAGSTSSSAGTPKTPTESANPGDDQTEQTSTAAGCSVALGSNGNRGAAGFALLALGLFGFARRRRVAAR